MLEWLIGLSIRVYSRMTDWFIPERATSLAFSVLGELVKLCILPIIYLYEKNLDCDCGSMAVLIHFIISVLFSSRNAVHFLDITDSLFFMVQFIEGCSDMELSLEDSRILANCISGQIYDSDPIEFTKDLGARFALRRSILRMPGLSKLVSLVAKENDDVAPCSTVCDFAQNLQDLGADVKLVNCDTSVCTVQASLNLP
ncbi:hypothetical protein SASPL_113027 [Salvia splendens]|uniref:Uncharacterized protein n=1 Tax=Salvia splendens TaxID=180675 RepID=A0A8X8XZ85_SALSN|nr:hypothetical protein SASPL_113027 [Salvia splendens]